jgi:hypothetical protein
MKGPRMAAPPRKRRLGAEQRRALQLLASSPFGASEAIMVAHGFTRRMLAGLVRAGLATARGKTVKAGDNAIAVGRVRITAAGRRALEDLTGL